MLFLVRRDKGGGKPKVVQVLAPAGDGFRGMRKSIAKVRRMMPSMIMSDAGHNAQAEAAARQTCTQHMSS